MTENRLDELLAQTAIENLVREQTNDPGKRAIHELMDAKFAHDVQEDVSKVDPNAKAPSPEMYEKMRLYAARFKKRYPTASEERVQKAVAGYFNIRILPTPANEPA